ncbi:MAG: hypothetical protein GEU98_20735 [Pseudonocardiaceae bacterium]|nr:hypothetical protein [Pseudonocardiaceae bacterium]
MSPTSAHVPFVPASPELGTAAARWVLDGTTDFGTRVSALLPAGLPAYARILHPAWLEVHGTSRQVRWAEVARANGRTAHRLMQWPGITGIANINEWQYGQASVYDEAPEQGSLPEEAGRPLVEILRRHTKTPGNCWFGLWHGFGGLERLPRNAEVGMPGRTLWLYSATLDDAPESFEAPPRHQTANLWWPEDQAWCVATDIDLISTYVCGSAELVDELLTSSDLDVYPAGPEDPIHLRADQINPYPEL